MTYNELLTEKCKLIIKIQKVKAQCTENEKFSKKGKGRTLQNLLNNLNFTENAMGLMKQTNTYSLEECNRKMYV